MARSAAHLLFFCDFLTTAAALGAAAEQAPSGASGWELEIGEQQPARGFLFGSSQSLTSVPDHCRSHRAAGMEEKTNATSETI
ncbi:MAG: hypothetical protein ABI847_13145 [Anaerolineales bacterium]